MPLVDVCIGAKKTLRVSRGDAGIVFGTKSAPSTLSPLPLPPAPYDTLVALLDTGLVVHNLAHESVVMSSLFALIAILSNLRSKNEMYTLRVHEDDVLTTDNAVAAACAVLLHLLDASCTMGTDSLQNFVYSVDRRSLDPDLPLTHHGGFAAICRFLTALQTADVLGAGDGAPVRLIRMDPACGLSGLVTVFDKTGSNGQTMCAFLVFLLQHHVIPLRLLVSLLTSIFGDTVPETLLAAARSREETPTLLYLQAALDIMTGQTPKAPDLVAVTREWLNSMKLLSRGSAGTQRVCYALSVYTAANLYKWTCGTVMPESVMPVISRPLSLIPTSDDEQNHWTADEVIREQRVGEPPPKVQCRMTINDILKKNFERQLKKQMMQQTSSHSSRGVTFGANNATLI